MLYLLTQAVERAAERAPAREAVRSSGEHLTYGSLAERVNQLARVLVVQGVRRGDRVGIYQKKGLTSAVALYGIMKAGGAYVPLDPDAPLARLEFIVRDCGIRHLITEAAHTETLRLLIAQVPDLQCLIGIDSEGGLRTRCIPWYEVAQSPAGDLDVGAMEQDLAYILYTSGSTGVPKGVMHTHRSALSFAEIAAQTYSFTSDDRLSNHASLHFDLSTLDYFSAAVAGATTIIIPEIAAKLPASLSKLIADERMTVLYAVPFALTQLLLRGALDKRDLSALRWVLFGGEPFPTKHLRSLMGLLPQARFSNVYGPTEVNGVTYYVVPTLPEDSDGPIPIGGLYGNAEAIVVDENDVEVADGEAGELLVRTPTMMRGYWGRPDLNERARYRRVVHGEFEDVFHRTGDIVRRQPAGTLLFLGRKDRQVKVRGARIELDEIEAVIVARPEVEAAAVYLVDDHGGGRRIEAAVIPRPGADLRTDDLIRQMREQLPPYAVPGRIAVHSQFPRTSTGKIDRLQLQAQAASE